MPAPFSRFHFLRPRNARTMGPLPLRNMRMLVTRRAAVAVMLLLAAALGCGREPTRPALAFIVMSVGATPSTGSPTSPVTLSVSVRNAGPTQVWHSQSLCDVGIGVWVLGPDGKTVLLSDPKQIRPDCPGYENVPFPPGQNLPGGATFTGTLYVPDSQDYPTPTYAAPAGRYTVVAAFAYRTEPRPEAPWIRIERRATFDWQP